MLKLRTQLKSLWDKGAAHIFIGNFLAKFAAFFGSIFLVWILPKEDFGILSYGENIFGYFGIFAGFGFANAIVRYVVIGDTIDEKYSFFRYSLTIGSISNVFVVGAGIFFCSLYLHPAAFMQYSWLFALWVIAIPCQYILNCSQMTLRAMFDNKFFAYLSLSTSVAVIAGRLAGAKIAGISGVVISIIIISAASGLLLTHFVKTRYFSTAIYRPLEKTKKRELFRYSVQYMFTNGLWAIFMLNDTFLLGQIVADPALLAEYKVAYVIPGNISILSSSIGLFVGPYFTRWEHEKKYATIRKNYRKTLLATLAVMGAATLFFAVFANQAIEILYGQQYISAAPIMRVLLLAAFINCGLRFTNANLLASMGIVKYNLLVSAIGVAMQLAINIFMVPRYGAIGLAWTSVAVYLLMSVALFIAFRKLFYKA